MSRRRLLPLLVACLLSLPPYAKAASADAEFPEIVVTASVEGADVRKLPASVQVLKSGDLARAGIRSVDEALACYVPGNGSVQPGGMSSAGLRGFRSNASVSSVVGDRVTLLVDGLRVSTGNPSFIPFSLVDRIEIVRGPASVLYGGSAMGGVVNVITKRGKGEMEGEVGASAGRFDSYRAYAALSGGLSDGWGMAVAAGAAKRGDYATGSGMDYRNTHTSHADAGATATFVSDSATLHVLGVHRSLYDNGSPGIPGHAMSATPGDRSVSHYSRGAGLLEYRAEGGQTFSAALFGDGSRYRFFDGTWGGGETRYSTATAGSRLTASFPLGALGRLSAGLDYANIRESVSGDSVYQPDMRYDVLGIFAEHRWEGDRLSTFSGLRGDVYRGRLRSNSGISVPHRSKDFDHLSWSAGAVYWLTDWLGAKASAGTAFVPPTAVSLVGDYGSGWSRYVGNADLDAETSLTVQGGLEADFGAFRAELLYFQSWYEDRITTVYDASRLAYTWRNSGSQRLDGFDLSLWWRGRAGDVTFVPYLESEIFLKRRNGDGTPVTVVPEYSAVAGIGLGCGRFWLDVNARLTGGQRQAGFDYDTYESRIVDMDAYSVVNARLTWHATDSLDLYCGVDNLADRDYAVTVGYPMPGRAVYGGFVWRF